MTENPEEYHVSEESAVSSEETGTTYDVTGEPETTPHDEVLAESDDSLASNPNSASSGGLAGDMGLSSERTGPADETGSSLSGIEGTGTVGTARTRTDGVQETDPGEQGDPAEAKTVPESDEEANTAEPGKHQFDPGRNPGHTHG